MHVEHSLVSVRVAMCPSILNDLLTGSNGGYGRKWRGHRGPRVYLRRNRDWMDKRGWFICETRAEFGIWIIIVCFIWSQLEKITSALVMVNDFSWRWKCVSYLQAELFMYPLRLPRPRKSGPRFESGQWKCFSYLQGQQIDAILKGFNLQGFNKEEVLGVEVRFI